MVNSIMGTFRLECEQGRGSRRDQVDQGERRLRCVGICACSRIRGLIIESELLRLSLGTTFHMYTQ
jgi:hypothetical protein